MISVLGQIGLEFRGTMMELYIFFGLILFAGAIIASIFWLWWFPKPAKTLAMAHRRKDDILFLATDAGNIELVRGKNFEQGQYEVKGRKKSTKIYLAPSPASEPWATKRYGVRGMSSAWLFGHEAFPQLANPLTLMLFYLNRVKNLYDKEMPKGVKKLFKTFEGFQASFAEETKGESTVQKIIRRAVVLLAPGQVQDVADRMWDMGSIVTQCRRHEWIGENKAKRQTNILVLLIIFVAVCIAGGLIFMFVGRG